jgi:hypothetical protein
LFGTRHQNQVARQGAITPVLWTARTVIYLVVS